MSDNAIDTEIVEVTTPDADDSAPAEDAPAVADADYPAEPEAGDTFPREVVEKLRKESASYRDRARTAEDRLVAMQRHSAEGRITAAGMRPEAVWAVASLDDVLADDGTVDMAKVELAMQTARKTLGITQKRAPFPGMGELNSGATGVRDHTPGPGFETAFAPRKR